ncbi:D-amino-acid transaminase [Chryseomicrobium sp. FSL W7-1435]|uniref:D-amino-acid transaminase n=1 Tax=Chryseomicrobium sp. FSL W7-1435 TaxID=2921704 RepID=UPI00315A84B0
MEKVLWNDQLVGRDDVHISIEDRGYQFGDGIYEVVKVYNGDVFTATEHIDRLYASADKIGMAIPYTKDVLHHLIHQLIEVNELGTGIVYLQVTRGYSPRNHAFPTPAVEAVITGYTRESARPMQELQTGVPVCLVEDVRWLRCDIKSLNLLGNVMAKQYAVERGGFEAVQHRGEVITEGSSSNAYGIKNGTLYTHPVNNLILNGITRQVILDCCEEIGLPVVEEAFTKQQAFDMDEFFISSTGIEVMPVTRIDETPIGDGTPGKWTRKLQQAFEAKLPQQLHV